MKKLLILLLLLFAASAEAAGPVTHVYLSKRLFHYFPTRFNESEQCEFIIGTLFPDIRYMGELKRCETHYETMTLTEVLGAKTPFMAGVKFHSYVDLVRDQYIRKQRPAVHQAELDTPHFCTYLKLLEDEVLFKVGDWHDYILGLKLPHPDEDNWEIGPEEIKKWHSIMSLCLQYPPSKVMLLLSITQSGIFGSPPELVERWRQLIPETAQSREVNRHVEQLVDHFEKEMRRFINK